MQAKARICICIYVHVYVCTYACIRVGVFSQSVQSVSSVSQSVQFSCQSVQFSQSVQSVSQSVQFSFFGLPVFRVTFSKFSQSVSQFSFFGMSAYAIHDDAVSSVQSPGLPADRIRNIRYIPCGLHTLCSGKPCNSLWQLATACDTLRHVVSLATPCNIHRVPCDTCDTCDASTSVYSSLGDFIKFMTCDPATSHC